MPTFAEALTQARQMFQAGDLPRAKFIYLRLIEAAPQEADPWHELGLLELQAGRPYGVNDYSYFDTAGVLGFITELYSEDAPGKSFPPPERTLPPTAGG